MNLFENFISHIDLDNPDFKNKKPAHDWRNYVPDDWIKNWGNLTDKEKKIIAVMAEIQADKENWDITWE